MTKDDSITFKCEKEFKAKVIKLAEADGRTMSNYIMSILTPIVQQKIAELDDE